jgi:hypothetical protein
MKWFYCDAVSRYAHQPYNTISTSDVGFLWQNRRVFAGYLLLSSRRTIAYARCISSYSSSLQCKCQHRAQKRLWMDLEEIARHFYLLPLASEQVHSDSSSRKWTVTTKNALFQASWPATYNIITLVRFSPSDQNRRRDIIGTFGFLHRIEKQSEILQMYRCRG